MSDTGLARADMLFRGVELPFGSNEEALAIAYFNEMRSKELSINAAKIPPSKDAINILENMKNSIFPEARAQSVARLKKSSEMMKGIKSDGIYVKKI